MAPTTSRIATSSSTMRTSLLMCLARILRS
jgi:hypothetical protein